KNLNIREMRQELGRIDEVLAREGEVIITRRGEPIARVLPIGGRKPFRSHAKLRASMPRQEVPSAVYIREDRDSR
ncbi:MAG: type II toxin-antitoxin system Phd/YefM family antitoxin, partial [Burkholderiales bacterium]